MEEALNQYEETLNQHIKTSNFTVIRLLHDVISTFNVIFQVPKGVNEDEFWDETIEIEEKVLDENGIYTSCKSSGTIEIWLREEAYDKYGNIIKNNHRKHIVDNDIYYNGDDEGYRIMLTTLLNRIKTVH
ncbi:hypothetical protein V1503_23575 [Bacillus sp. SCS-151]|uniref:hypothetical protein n=1 Tax=Nanhaiella sioensis TaxID=3115293 RepID=UPI0039794CC7